MRLFFSFSLIFILVLLSRAQETAIVSLSSTQDVLINSQNIQGEIELLGFGSEGEENVSRSLLKFDFSELPFGTLKQATLSLTMANEGTGIISLHKVTQNWKGSDYTNFAHATWEETGINENEWDLPGGDYSTIPSGRAIFNNNETLDILGPRMKLDIQEWIDNPDSNHGWMIRGTESANDSKTYFHSGKNLIQGPILTLIYELPDTCYAQGGDATTIGGQTVVAKCLDQNELRFDLQVLQAHGENKIWLICDEEGDILGFSINTAITPAHFSEQTLNIYHLSFNGEILGASVGNNIRNLVGCHSLSNKIEILGNAINGGDIATTFGDKNVTICPYDLQDIDNLTVQNDVGVLSFWAVIDDNNIIQILDTEKPTGIKDLTPGNYKIQHLSYQGDLEGIAVGNDANSIVGCYDWSNPINVSLLDINLCRPACSLEGNTIRGEVLQVCPGSTIGSSFKIDSLRMNVNHGPFAIWILTDRRGNTIEAIPDVGLSNYKLKEKEIVYLFHVTYEELTFQFRNNIYDLNGCYGISNALPIQGVYLEDCPLYCELPQSIIASTEYGTSVDLCEVSSVSELNLTTELGDSYPWRYVVKNSNDDIIAIGDESMVWEFDEVGVYQFSKVIANEESDFDNFIGNLERGKTCYVFSNEISLEKSVCPLICMAPETFKVSESSEGSVSIRWERVQGAQNYDFEIGFDTDSTDLTLMATHRNFMLLSNPSHRTLIFRVRTKCGEDDYSPYSDFFVHTSAMSNIATARNLDITRESRAPNISPNPASEKITLEFQTFNKPTIAQIYNATGKLVQEERISSDRKFHSLNISNLESGIHFIRLSDENGQQYQKKFIKVK